MDTGFRRYDVVGSVDALNTCEGTSQTFMRLLRPAEAVLASDQHVVHPAILKFSKNRQPELGALILFDPDAQNVLLPINVNADGEIDRFVANASVVADLQPDRIEENYRINIIQWSGLPRLHVVHYVIGNMGYKIG